MAVKKELYKRCNTYINFRDLLSSVLYSLLHGGINLLRNIHKKLSAIYHQEIKVNNQINVLVEVNFRDKE